jgi:hypothetical protein
MPWKECSVMKERMRLVLRRLDEEPMSGLCREFGISRKTGYKIFERYQHHGLEARSLMKEFIKRAQERPTLRP